MFALFPQLPDWKSILKSMCETSNKFVNFACALRLSGTTVIDLDTSYFYYLDSEKRVYQIFQNIYEMLNYLCISELNISKINFYGYRNLNHSPDAFRPLPNDEIIFGNFLLEIDRDFYTHGRTGGCSQLRDLKIENVKRKQVGPSIHINIEDNICANANEIGKLAKKLGL